jgi:uncharacterized RDD family membrane protein YckC
VAKLIVNPTSSARREISLARTLISIGRDPGNDVVLPDAMVSRRHAVIEFRGAQYFIRDCNSSNGSLVNGDRVSERNLRDGDLVAIGTARMLFREELDAEESAAKVVQHPSSPKLHCPTCQADYRKGDQFCRQCGTSVAPAPPAKAVCASCGTVVMLPAKFCNACGRVLPADASRPEAERAPDAPPAEPGAGPVADAAPAVEAAVGEAAPGEASPEKAADDVAPAAPAPIPVAVAAPLPAPMLASPPPPSVATPARAAAPAIAIAPPPPPRREVPRPPVRPAPLPPIAQGPRSVPPRPVAAVGPTGTASLSAAGTDALVLPRLTAGLIDTAIVSAVQAVLLWPVARHWWARELPATPNDVPYFPILLSLAMIPIAIVLGAAYYAIFWGLTGATPGKRMLGLAVAAEDGTTPIGMSRATLRVLGYCASALLLGIGFLMIAFGGTALHDRIAGTRVVRRGAGL